MSKTRSVIYRIQGITNLRSDGNEQNPQGEA
jgi:hypothetical protein